MLMDQLWEVRKRKESTGRLEMPSTEMRKRTSPVAQMVKNLPEMWETWVQSLGWEDPLEKGKVTCSSTLARRIPWTVLSMGSQSQTRLSILLSCLIEV